MSSLSLKAPQQKSNEESLELQNDTNADLGVESRKECEKESENEKPQSPEVVLNIDESMQEHLKTGFSNKNVLLSECRSKPEPRKRVPTTLVYYFEYFTGHNEPTDDEFKYSSDRNGFVRLVMIVVFLLISATAACVYVVLLVDVVSEFCEGYSLTLAVVGFFIVMAVLIALSRPSNASKSPYIIICLLITGVGGTIICAASSAHFGTDYVLFNMGSIAGVALVCFLVAFTSFDFTSSLLYVIQIFTVCVIMTLITVINKLITGDYMKKNINYAISTGIISVFIVRHLQVILDGTLIKPLREDDYALAALVIYALFMLFIFLFIGVDIVFDKF